MPINADIDTLMELFETIEKNKPTPSKKQKILKEKDKHDIWLKLFHKIRLYFRLEEDNPKCNYVWDLLHASEDGRIAQTLAILKCLKILNEGSHPMKSRKQKVMGHSH